MIDAPLGRWNLYIGGAGCFVDGYVNLDLFSSPGVDVIADAHQLPFACCMFQRVECDAVLEHVRQPEIVMREIERVLAPGGYAHIVVPFCHPFHEYPRDFRRFTLDGVKEMTGGDARRSSGLKNGAHSDNAGLHHGIREALVPLACMACGGTRSPRMDIVPAALFGLRLL
ncbi:MAG: methyltransferase domain-containing protein [Acidobacteria bacterium]|nr:methyltransferase domain-containing protein [Acidobacteriota bacterium]